MDFPKSVSGIGLVNGKFVDEDEQTGQQGSLIPAAWGNMVTDEILSVQQAAGIEASEADSAQLSKALDILYLGGAQCRLAGTTQTLTLSRMKRGAVLIPGYGLAKVPEAGVTLNAAGLVAGTVYNIYAYMNADVMTLEASTVGRATDAATGLQIKNGDRTRLFVGMEYASAANAWAGWVRSWYNDTGYVGVNSSSSTSTGSTSFVSLAGLKANFLAFAGEMARSAFVGLTNTSVSGYSSYTQMSYDGAAVDGNLSTQVQSATANSGNTLVYSMPKKIVADGLHYAQLLGRTDNGSSTWTGGMTVEVQPTGR